MKVILPRERKIYPKRTVDPNRINSKSPDYLTKKKKKPKQEKVPPEPQKITVPVIDWAKSELFYKCSQNNEPIFINDQEMKEAPCFRSIDELTKALKSVQDDYCSDDEDFAPFNLKCQQTYSRLLWEQGFPQDFIDHMLDKYPALNLEDTMKLMLRSKPLFIVRDKIVQIMVTYNAFKTQIEKFRTVIEKFTTYQILDHEMIEIKDCSDLICQIGYEALCYIKEIPSVHKFYEGTDFMLEGQDLIQWIKFQMAKAKKVTSSFNIYKDRDPASYRFYFPDYNKRDRLDGGES